MSVINKKTKSCSIQLTPKQTQQVLSKMKVPQIPNIAVIALNLLNNSNNISR